MQDVQVVGLEPYEAAVDTLGNEPGRPRLGLRVDGMAALGRQEELVSAVRDGGPYQRFRRGVAGGRVQELDSKVQGEVEHMRRVRRISSALLLAGYLPKSQAQPGHLDACPAERSPVHLHLPSVRSLSLRRNHPQLQCRRLRHGAIPSCCDAAIYAYWGSRSTTKGQAGLKPATTVVEVAG